mgnify:CR=1 FL=1
MCNGEGYTDKTADIAVAHVMKEERKRRGGKKYGDKRCTEAKKSQAARQH